MNLTKEDSANIKKLFKHPTRKVFVDIKNQKATVYEHNVKIGFIEKHPSEWSFVLTSDLHFRFKYLDKQPVIIIKGALADEQTVPLNADISNVVHKKGVILSGAIIMLNEKKNSFYFPNVFGIELTIPRFIVERTANFKRNVDYEFIYA